MAGASLVAQLVKNLPAMRETPGSISRSGRTPGEGIGYPLQYCWASLVVQMVKNLPAMWETWVWPQGWVGKIHWRRAWQPTLVFLPGESPWTAVPGRLWLMGSESVRHNWATKHNTWQGTKAVSTRHCFWWKSPQTHNSQSCCGERTAFPGAGKELRFLVRTFL